MLFVPSVMTKVIAVALMRSGGLDHLDENAGIPPREVTVGIYIERSIWQVTLFL